MTAARNSSHSKRGEILGRIALNQVIRDTVCLDLCGVDRKAATDNQYTRLHLAAILTELDARGREMPDPPGRSTELPVGCDAQCRPHKPKSQRFRRIGKSKPPGR